MRKTASTAACRLCDENKPRMHSIFEKNSDGQQILYLIKECLPIVIFRTDPLSKQVCEECLTNLETFYKFKKTSLATATRHINHLRQSDGGDKSVRLYLACEETEMVVQKRSLRAPGPVETSSVATSTDDLAAYKRFDGEVELCSEFAGERTRRRRSQAFYHELDDSLCSTEYTASFEDSESEESEPEHRAKRRKLEETASDEPEHRYFPLSLMQLALNVVNRRIVPGHRPDDFYVKLVEPRCRYCGRKFRNSKLLALHEVDHISIELGEKVDNPVPWHESRPDAHVRNRWLGSFDDRPAEEAAPESLLIPVGSEEPRESAGDILLVMAKPTVNGVALSEYSKEERKAFYKSMKIGGVNKKFCPLCRYSFKDNWAIESHYFSLACYYTCRYCGMRFNKQRHRFDEHVREHEQRSDPLSTKIYAASKLNNFVPKVIQPEKVKRVVAEQERRPQPIKVKEERPSSDEETRPKPTANQAYFCRKCYKVFFKLDEFNVHSKNCDYNQFPPRNKFPPRNGEVVSSSGRPVRHCVRESYKDDAFEGKEQQSFVCFICNTPFPTIYSRNSHMRIHKGEANHKQPPAPRPPAPNFIKQEPLEPEIQIHESESNYNSSIGAVSITPISKNPNQKATINPNIMKLVQNNPHLTIKANKSPERQVQERQPSGSNQEDKTYKCSSCWEAFANKSHLYFHKKNQCEGSKYPCPFCKKRFGTEAAYSSHIFYSHPE